MGLFDKLFNNKHEELTQEVGNVNEQALDEKRDMIEGIEELPNTAVKEVMEEYFGYNNDKIDEDLELKTSEIQIIY